MEKIYRLENREVDEVKFTCRLITDRQYPSATIEDWLENWTPFSRMDMFWIELELDGEDLGSFSVDPSLDANKPEEFSISRNHCKVDGEQQTKLITLAREWFVQQPEYKQQQEWIKSINERIFAPSGGISEFVAKGRVQRETFKQHKIAVATKYTAQFAELFATLPAGKTWLSGHPNSKELKGLSEQLQTENVYRSCEFISAGIDHIGWIYKTYVANKTAY